MLDTSNPPLQNFPTQAFLQRWGTWSIILIGLLMLVPGTAWLPLVDRDEPRFSQATREMMDRGDWVVPSFNGQYRFDKPPLTYWWMSLFYTVLGVNELGARLHSVVSCILSAWVIWIWGAKLFSPRTGWLAAVGWLTCFQIFIHGRLALADMPMILAIIVTQWALWELLTPDKDPGRTPWFWVLWLSAAFGFLAKGPLAMAVPALGLILFRWVFWRKPLPWRRLRVLTGIPVMLAPIAAWGIPALLTTQGDYWDVGIGTHVVERGVGAFNDRSFLPGFYFLTAPLSLFPWFGLIVLGIARIRKGWDQRNAFFLSWFLAPMLIFTFYATQLPHYTLPGFPAFFFLLFQSDFLPQKRKWDILWFRSYCCLFGLVILIFLGAGLLFPFPGFLADFNGVLLGAGLLLLGYWLLPFGIRLNRPIFLGLGILAVALGVQIGFSTIRPTVLTLRFAQHPAIQEVLDQTPVPSSDNLPITEAEINQLPIGWRFAEGGLIYYGNHFWDFWYKPDSPPDPRVNQHRAFLSYLETEYRFDAAFNQYLAGKIITPTEDNRELLNSLDHTGYTVHHLEGFNLARTSWVRLRVLIPRKPLDK